MWDIKIKGDMDRTRASKLAQALCQLEPLMLNFGKISGRNLRRNRLRIYPFSRKEGANEIFLRYRNKKYICLNASLLKRRYWASLQYLLHGLAHSFCYLRDGIAEEVFCEYVGYKGVENLLAGKSLGFRRRILRSIVRTTHKSYRAYIRAARRLDEREEGFILKLNRRARVRKLSQIREKKIIYRALKASRASQPDEDDGYMPELERGFRRLAFK